MTACIICDREMSPWLRQPLDPKKNTASAYEDFSYCRPCAFGSMTTTPPAADIPGFYQLGAYYTQGESHIKPAPQRLQDKLLTKLAFWADRGRARAADDFKALVPENAQTLDVGCGAGDLLKDYAQLGWSASGVEPDPSAVSREAPFRVFQGTAEDMPADLQTGGYDLISMTHVLEHCIDPVRALENVRRLLKDDGVFWCEVPNCGCIHFNDINVCSEMFDAPRHIHFFTPGSLRKIMDKAGFDVTDVYFHGYTRHHNRDWREWERTISANTKRLAPDAAAPDHTFLKSAGILLRSAFAPKERKYDCVGVIARKKPAG